jgi:preprotein translocase subunit SecA
MRWLERRIILDVVDSQWKDHLLSLDHLKEGIGLRGYGQKDPLVEFKKEGFVLFEEMMTRIDNETIRYLYHIQLQQGEPPQGREPRRELLQQPLPARPHVRARSRQICRDSRAKWNAGNSGSNRICSTKRVRRRRKRPSPFAPAQKWGATILVRAGPAKSTRNATAPERTICWGNDSNGNSEIEIGKPVRIV